MIHKQTGNLRAVQILLGHTKIESTVRYFGVAVDDALTLADRTEILTLCSPTKHKSRLRSPTSHKANCGSALTTGEDGQKAG